MNKMNHTSPAKPLNQIKVIMTGTQPELEKMFVASVREAEKRDD